MYKDIELPDEFVFELSESLKRQHPENDKLYTVTATNNDTDTYWIEWEEGSEHHKQVYSGEDIRQCIANKDWKIVKD